MRTSRNVWPIVLLLVVIAASWFVLSRPRNPAAANITVYYTKADGRSLVPWTVSMRAPERGESNAEHARNTVLYAATQVMAGPPSTVAAVRFPPGTHALSAAVNGSTAMVDISKDVESDTGSYGETAEFKSLVWTLTGLPGIDAVAVRVNGEKLDTLPGGHVELDQPLRRSDFSDS